MMQGAELIVGIDGAMVVILVATAAVRMVVVGMHGDAGPIDVVREVLFACHDMLDMDADQRHDTGERGNQEQP